MPKIPINDVVVKDRFRATFGDLESLMLSISRLGLLHPIVIDENKQLIAGERRLRACKELGLDEIEVKFYADADDLTKKEIELEENIKRKDFEWDEEVTAKAELDRIKRAMYGSAMKGDTTAGATNKWNIHKTAEALGESVGTVSQDLQLAGALINFPELRNEKTKNAAWKAYQRLKERLMTGELARRVVTNIQESDLVEGDCLDVLKAEPDCSYDLIVTDPPYGVNIHNAGAQRDKWGEEVFDDDTESTMSLMKKVFPEMYRVLKPDTHAYVFFAMTYYAEFKKMLEDAGFDVVPTPIIWNKTSQSAPPVTPYSFTQAYEPIFLCHKGRRSLNAYIPNVISMDRVSSSQTIHVTQKPTQLMKKLIEASSAAGDLVLDPFCGSGSTIIAAYESKRRVKGIEKDSDMCAKVLLRIKDFSGGVVRGVEPADGGTPTPAVTELVNEF